METRPLKQVMSFNEFINMKNDSIDSVRSLESAKSEPALLARIRTAFEKKRKINIEDVKTYRNCNQTDARNYIAVRVFSKKFRDDMQHRTLERASRRGREQPQLIGQTYTTFLPRNTKPGDLN